MIKDYKIPLHVEIDYQRTNMDNKLLYEYGDQVYFKTFEEQWEYVESVYFLIKDCICNYLSITLETDILLIESNKSRIFYDLKYDIIFIGAESSLFITSPVINNYLLIKTLCHELGHAIHHHISMETTNNISKKETLLTSENIAHYSEIVFAEILSQDNNYDFSETSFIEYKGLVLDSYYRTFDRINSSTEEIGINQLINLPFLILTKPIISDKNFLKNYLFKGYRHFEQFSTEIDIYFKEEGLLV